MPSKNSFSADNQQERLEIAGWIVGFVDGEGCFSVSLIQNKTTKFKYQVFPEFVVTQGAKSLSSLKLLQTFFKCGTIVENKRRDNHKESLYKYCVRSQKDLREKITPFFQKYKLRTAKREDFDKFVKIVNLLNLKKHLEISGLKEIARIIEQMNRKIPSRFLESSETVRQTCYENNKEDTVRAL